MRQVLVEAARRRHAAQARRRTRSLRHLRRSDRRDARDAAPTRCWRSTPRSTQLARIEPRQALMVESRFFGGLDVARDGRAARACPRPRCCATGAPRKAWLAQRARARGPLTRAIDGPARWERIQALFHAAVELPARTSGAAFLDGRVRRTTRAARATCSPLLEEDARGASLLDRGVARRRAAACSTAAPTRRLDRVRPLPHRRACSAKAAWASSTSPSATDLGSMRGDQDPARRLAVARAARALRRASSARSRSSTIRPSRGCYDAGTLPRRHAVVRDGVRRGRAAHRATAARTARRSPSGCACSARCARRCSTRTGTWSSTATSSRRTSS